MPNITSAAVLQADHPLLKDGMNDGFRAPDLGWVGTQGEAGELAPWMFNGGSSLFSNWWAGPRDQAKALAETLVGEFRAALAAIQPQGPEEEYIPVVSVGYWEDPMTGLALVGQQSVTEDFMLFDGPIRWLEASLALASKLLQVGSDGNDNSPYSLFEGCSDWDPDQREGLINLLFTCARKSERDDLREYYQETHANRASG